LSGDTCPLAQPDGQAWLRKLLFEEPAQGETCHPLPAQAFSTKMGWFWLHPVIPNGSRCCLIPPPDNFEEESPEKNAQRKKWYEDEKQAQKNRLEKYTLEFRERYEPALLASGKQFMEQNVLPVVYQRLLSKVSLHCVCCVRC